MNAPPIDENTPYTWKEEMEERALALEGDLVTTDADVKAARDAVKAALRHLADTCMKLAKEIPSGPNCASYTTPLAPFMARHTTKPR